MGTLFWVIGVLVGLILIFFIIGVTYLAAESDKRRETLFKSEMKERKDKNVI